MAQAAESFEATEQFKLIRETVESSGNKLSIKSLCELAGVHRSAYYRWLNPYVPKIRDKESQDQIDFQLILEAYNFRGYSKGVMGIYMRLLHMGIRMNHKKIRRLMHKYGLMCPIRKANPYRRMAKAMRTNVVADNHLQRRFKAFGARAVFLTDITYIPFNDAFLYLSVIMDAFTEQVMSYVLSDSLEVDFVLLTVQKLFEKHTETINATAMIHSEQGCHYTSTSFRELISNYGLRQSMSRRGNCWDNAPQESFFGHMKDELSPYIKTWKTFDEVQNRINDWINYYNNDRYQVQLQGMAPNEYYHYKVTNQLPSALTMKYSPK